MNKLTKKQITNFVKEYDALCKKWGCMIVSEDSYCGVELMKLTQHVNTKIHKDQLEQLKERV